MKTSFERLKAVSWGSAQEWNPVAHDLLLDFYERILPVWPEDHVRLMPHSSVLTEAFSSRLTASELEQVKLMLRAVLDTAEKTGIVLSSVNRALVMLILTCEVLIERRDLAPHEDPSGPLLRLLEQGYDLNPSHGAVDICCQLGCTSVPLPARESVAQRAVSHAVVDAVEVENQSSELPPWK